MLSVNKELRELNLHYNNFGAKGGEHFFTKASGNTSLRILDLSWNSMGRNGKYS
jgi:hypothetical protein